MAYDPDLDDKYGGLGEDELHNNPRAGDEEESDNDLGRMTPTTALTSTTVASMGLS